MFAPEVVIYAPPPPYIYEFNYVGLELLIGNTRPSWTIIPN